jgi:hypothetical protein
MVEESSEQSTPPLLENAFKQFEQNEGDTGWLV